MAKEDILALEKVTAEAEAHAIEIEADQAAIVAAAAEDVHVKILAAEAACATVRELLAATSAESPEYVGTKDALALAEKALADLEQETAASIAEMQQLSDEMVAIAAAAAKEARDSANAARAGLVSIQIATALKLLRYAQRLVPSDAATAKAILGTLEPEAIQQAQVQLDIEIKRIAAELRQVDIAESREAAGFPVPSQHAPAESTAAVSRGRRKSR